MAFRDTVSLDERTRQAGRALERYPDKTPVIIETGELRKRLFRRSSQKLPQLDKSKFLVPHEMTLAQFSCLIRQRFSEIVTPEMAIFVLINNTLPKNTAMMRELWDESREKDGFLYVTFVPENTFG
jgi:hypothetical protein